MVADYSRYYVKENLEVFGNVHLYRIYSRNGGIFIKTKASTKKKPGYGKCLISSSPEFHVGEEYPISRDESVYYFPSAMERSKKYQYSFLNELDIEELSHSNSSLVVLVRCGADRFTCSVSQLQEKIEEVEDKGDYVRDVSLPVIQLV